MLSLYLKNQKGSVLVLFALVLTVILGFVGLAVDLGNLNVQKTIMQNAVDAAVLAGGQELPSTVQAAAKANQYLTSNNENPANATVTFSNGNQQINITLTRNVSTFFMGVLGIQTVPISVTAAGLLAGAGGPFNYGIFSQQNLNINGSNYSITGSVHSDKNININGSSITITGTAEAKGNITTNGSGINIGSRSANATGNIPMPDYSADIAAAAAAAHQTYTGSKTINGSSITSDPIYVQGSPGTISVNGSAFTATGTVMADGNITINGSGVASGNSQVCFYSKTGNIYINGSDYDLNGVLYAPNGSIFINGSQITVNGSIVGKQININGSQFTVDRTNYPITALKGHGVYLVQ